MTQIMRMPAEPYAPTAATMITPARYASQIPPLPPPIYYELEQPVHRRPIWPWIAALLFVAGAGIGGWYIYHQISSKLSNSAPVAVRPLSRHAGAGGARRDQGGRLQPGREPPCEPHDRGRARLPAAADRRRRVAKGSAVTIWVSTGKPKVEVPSLAGMQSADARGGADEAAPEAGRPPGAGRRAGGDRDGARLRRPARRSSRAARCASTSRRARRPFPCRTSSASTISDATSQLEAARLQGRPNLRRTPTQPANTVIDAEPERGRHGGEGLGRQPHGLEGPEDGRGART